ncbi:unnamed protein product, partial [Microthlaspi erraticum]
TIDMCNKAKVAWSTVCLPKAEGGLGLRRCIDWNRVLNLRLIWLLFSSSGSLWVAWHKHHNHNDVSNFWMQSESNSQSWTWRSLLRLRPLAGKFLRCTLAAPRSERALALHIFLSTIALPLDPLKCDSYHWYVKDQNCHGFSAAKTWEIVRPREAEKSWSASVWFKGATPRNAFTMWIATLDRLPVRSRLVAWGLQVSPVCVLCSSQPESRDHLMLSCHFSSTIWREVMARIDPSQPDFSSWTGLLTWTCGNSNNSPSMLRKLVTQAVVNGIWKQRNNLLHNSVSVTPLCIFRDLDRHIINTINARRSRRDFENLMSHWLR